MIILKLLSEEVFDFSSGQMTQTKAKHLKDTMCSQFSDVFQLCQFVLDNSQNAPLVGATLETLLRFLNWIPLGYIFETKLIETLIFKFFNVPMFRNITLKCLTEIAAVSVSHYDEMFVSMFTQAMQQLELMLPTETNIKEAYANGMDAEQQFIQDLVSVKEFLSLPKTALIPQALNKVQKTLVNYQSRVLTLVNFKPNFFICI